MRIFPFKWNISDGYPSRGIPNHKLKVFGTFICGGGSTMGYKLAGYDHIGGVELDKSLAEVYRINHTPKHLYLEDIRVFNKRDDLPEELFDLHILDGSPPCSTFSLAGNRESDWGKEKTFKEGQTLQRLDDLFFDYIDLVDKLKPKVAIAENVRGLISGNAKAYVSEIISAFKKIGYRVQVFLLNAASMGVPQKRERVFFICSREDLHYPPLNLEFSEKPIFFKEIESEVTNPIGDKLSDIITRLWEKCPAGRPFSKVHPKGSYFNSCKISPYNVAPTVCANDGSRITHYKYPNRISDDCLKLIGTFPMDYDFLQVWPQYLIGMSVPPVMTARIAHEIYLQWFNNN